VGRGVISEDVVDLARAGAILHDMRKSGDRATARQSSASDHDLQMAEHIRDWSGLPDRLADAVATHMGPWYDGPKPANGLDELLHNADMVASTSTITPKVQGPLPSELKSIGVEAVDDE
jgi:hypothetical protein